MNRYKKSSAGTSSALRLASDQREVQSKHPGMDEPQVPDRANTQNKQKMRAGKFTALKEGYTNKTFNLGWNSNQYVQLPEPTKLKYEVTIPPACI